MNWTEKSHELLIKNISMEDALPTRMPVYVNSVSYLFGVSALSGLVLLIVSGLILAFFGPTWYHYSGAGHFVNSIHFWSVQIFFGMMILHMTAKFFKAAWRDGRWRTWTTGMLIFGAAVFTGLTGYLSQTNWDSQWISVQSKDAMNALGIGSFFNTMDTGQVLTLHVVFLPFVVTALVAVHLFFIRRDGPVKPFPANSQKINKTLKNNLESAHE